MNKIVFHRISFDVTFRCTLKCKLCCAYAPQHPQPYPHYSLSELTSWMTRYFEISDYTDIFTIGGGEPFLHENLADIFDFLIKYRQRIGRLEVITNGTILPSENLIKSLKKADARVLLDDYGAALSTKAPQIAEMLESSGVNFEYRNNNASDKGAHCNGWVDISSFSSEPRPQKEAQKLFDKCIQAHELRCNPVINGKIYVCPAYEYCLILNKIPDNPIYYVDLADNITPFEQQKAKVREYLALNYIPSCAFCNGFCKDSKRYIPAEQFTSEEISRIQSFNRERGGSI